MLKVLEKHLRASSNESLVLFTGWRILLPTDGSIPGAASHLHVQGTKCITLSEKLRLCLNSVLGGKNQDGMPNFAANWDLSGWLTLWEHPDSRWGNPWSGILAWLLQSVTMCLYGGLYWKFSGDLRACIDVLGINGIISARSVITLSHNLMEANPNSFVSLWLCLVFRLS